MTNEQCELEGINLRAANSPFAGQWFGRILGIAAFLAALAILANN